MRRPVLGVCSLRHLGASWPVPLPRPAHSRPLPAFSLVRILMPPSYWSRVSGSCCTLGEKSSGGDNHHDHHRRHHASLYPGRALSPIVHCTGGEESSSSVIASPQSSLSLAVRSLESHYLWIIIIILIIINLHHSAASYPPFAAQLRINIVSVLVITIRIEVINFLYLDHAYD